MSRAVPRRFRRAHALAGTALVALALTVGGCAEPAQPQAPAAATVTTESSVSAPSETQAEASERTAGSLPRSEPAWLEIPAIGVRTGQIIPLGLEPDGALEVPEDAVTAGWFERSPTPGELGPSIIAGHVDYDHVPGVFHRLHELPVGSQVTVHRADGTNVVFTVDEVERYPKSEFPTEAVYGNTEVPELRLITCGGAFDESSGNYVDNVVAFASIAQGGGK